MPKTARPVAKAAFTPGRFHQDVTRGFQIGTLASDVSEVHLIERYAGVLKSCLESLAADPLTADGKFVPFRGEAHNFLDQLAIGTRFDLMFLDVGGVSATFARMLAQIHNHLARRATLSIGIHVTDRGTDFLDLARAGLDELGSPEAVAAAAGLDPADFPVRTDLQPHEHPQRTLCAFGVIIAVLAPHIDFRAEAAWYKGVRNFTMAVLKLSNIQPGKCHRAFPLHLAESRKLAVLKAATHRLRYIDRNKDAA